MPSAPTSTISFARGAPSLDIVDVDGLRDAAVRAFESDPAGTTAYGTAIGYPRLRSWIAEHHGVAPERVLVTNGSMQADAFLFEHLVHSGDEVIVERPTYDRTLLSLRERGARVHAVELQPDGIDVDALERLLGPAGNVRPTLAHIIPNFQNPAGYTLSVEKRRRLLELAGDHGFLVFEDDPYVALRFGEASPPTMLSLNPEHVVYASSFSKTVCPGIRVGYLVGPEDLIAAITKLATNTYISPNMVAQSIVYEFCASGAIERSIETVRAALAERAATLASALRRELPEAQFVEPEGGYFMWVTLPEGTDVAALFDAAGGTWGGVREGHRLHARRRRERPPVGLLRGHPRADRDRRRPPRRGLQVAVGRRSGTGTPPRGPTFPTRRIRGFGIAIPYRPAGQVDRRRRR